MSDDPALTPRPPIETWGPVGHYTIGSAACDLVQPEALLAFFQSNRTSISYELSDIAAGKFERQGGQGFSPLADVPDHVWKAHGPGFRPHEGPNHYGELDTVVDGTTLLQRAQQDIESVNATSWLGFYNDAARKPHAMGLLPFRVQQLYELAVSSVEAGDLATAFAAVGVLAHYVGDACQPLHLTVDYDGRTRAENGVHEGYETTMVTEYAGAIGVEMMSIPPVDAAAAIRGGQAAAQTVGALMLRTVTALPPTTIFDAWNNSASPDSDHSSSKMWASLGPATIARIIDGASTLALLWTSAWAEAGTTPPPAATLPQAELQTKYLDQTFAPSLYLTELAPLLSRG